MPYAMIGNILGSTIGAAAGIYQQKQEQKFNAEQAQINRDFQTAEREATQQFNIDMWNMNNEYNSPTAQKQRLIDAGINPNAMFGTGASPASSTAVTSNPQSGSLAQTNSGLSSALVQAGSSLGINTANMMKSLSEKDNNEYQLKWNKKTESIRLEGMDALVKKDLAQIQRWMSQNGVDKATEQQLLELNKYIAPYKEKELKMMDAKLNDLAVDYRQKEAQIKLTEQQTKTEEQRTELVGTQTSNVEEDTYQKYLQNLHLEMQASFSKITGIPLNADCFHVAYTLWQQGAGAYSDYINNFVVPQHRASWYPRDYYYEKQYSSSKQSNYDGTAGFGPLQLGGHITENTSESGSRTHSSFFNGHDGFIFTKSPSFKTPSLRDLQGDKDYRRDFKRRRR